MRMRMPKGPPKRFSPSLSGLHISQQAALNGFVHYRPVHPQLRRLRLGTVCLSVNRAQPEIQSGIIACIAPHPPAPPPLVYLWGESQICHCKQRLSSKWPCTIFSQGFFFFLFRTSRPKMGHMLPKGSAVRKARGSWISMLSNCSQG